MIVGFATTGELSAFEGTHSGIDVMLQMALVLHHLLVPLHVEPCSVETWEYFEHLRSIKGEKVRVLVISVHLEGLLEKLLLHVYLLLEYSKWFREPVFGSCLLMLVNVGFPFEVRDPVLVSIMEETDLVRTRVRHRWVDSVGLSNGLKLTCLSHSSFPCQCHNLLSGVVVRHHVV